VFDIFYASVKAMTSFLLGALQAFFVGDLGLFDVFYQSGVEIQCLG